MRSNLYEIVIELYKQNNNIINYSILMKDHTRPRLNNK
jgi:hypothetical protein